jgi:hypothetical protein
MGFSHGNKPSSVFGAAPFLETEMETTMAMEPGSGDGIPGWMTNKG